MFKLTDEKRFRVFSTVLLTLLTVITLLPIILIIIASFTDEKALISYGYSYFPKAWSLNAYYYLINQGKLIMRAYGITILVTVVGTVTSVLITTMLAYPMSRKNFKYRNILSFFVFFTMLFNGGIVSSYMM